MLYFLFNWFKGRLLVYNRYFYSDLVLQFNDYSRLNIGFCSEGMFNLKYVFIDFVIPNLSLIYFCQKSLKLAFVKLTRVIL